MTDEPRVNTGGGAATNEARVAGDFTGRDARQHVTFQSTDNAIIWNAIIDLGNSISSVREKLDDLPNRVAKLEVQFQPLPIPLPVTYVPTWIIAMLIVLGMLFVGGAAFLLGKGF